MSMTDHVIVDRPIVVTRPKKQAVITQAHLKSTAAAALDQLVTIASRVEPELETIENMPIRVGFAIEFALDQRFEHPGLDLALETLSHCTMLGGTRRIPHCATCAYHEARSPLEGDDVDELAGDATAAMFTSIARELLEWSSQSDQSADCPCGGTVPWHRHAI